MNLAVIAYELHREKPRQKKKERRRGISVCRHQELGYSYNRIVKYMSLIILPDLLISRYLVI